MAATVYLKDIDVTYWSSASSNLTNLNFVNYLTRFFVLDPTTVANLGGTKTSTLTPTQIRANFQMDVSPTQITLLRENEYQTINWLNRGWTANVVPTFLQEVKTWVLNNIDNSDTNPFPATAGLVVHFGTGAIQPTGYSYNLVLIGYGNYPPTL